MSPQTLRAARRLPPLSADAVLICPPGGNTGDGLIADATGRFLREHGVGVWRSDGSLEEAAAEGDADYLGDFFSGYRGMVVFPGGGNIGIYPNNEHVRARILAHLRPHHRCLVFPQSALRSEPALADPRVTVWCRDATSRELLARAGVRTELVPDVALLMDDRIAKHPGGRGVFYVRRTPGCDEETLPQQLDCDCPSADLTLRDPLASIVAALEPYEFVISDRLHGGLIAMMMRKKVALLPVGYHKIRAFHDTWLKRSDGVAFIERSAELGPKLLSLRASGADLSELFRQHAEPAFERFLLSE